MNYIDKIRELGNQYNLDPASILAVADVESNGRSGFQENGLLTVLFEAHIFYKELKKLGLDADVLSKEYPNLICSTWNKSLYQGGDRENQRLSEALKINPIAWNCASYGMFQIMGFNHDKVGFKNAYDMVLFLKKSSINHIETFIRFIQSSKSLSNSFLNKDWVTFARLYNGTRYQENDYDIKLQRAYLKYCGILRLKL